MASPIPNALVQFIDNRGNPLANGSVNYFHPGTTTAKPTWRDPALSITNANPVVLDANGRAPIFGAGRYRQQVRAANGTVIYDAETMLGEADLPLAIELAGANFDGDVQTVATSGFSMPGKGAAQYVRLSQPPAANEQQAGLGRWLFRTNGNSVWWRLAETEPTDFMFGALANAAVAEAGGVMTVTGADDAAALQAAVDFVLYFGQGSGRRLRLPAGLRRIGTTIQIGYGDRYLDWQIEGDFARGYDDNAGYQAGLVADFNDRPAINIQGARSARISGISVYGLNNSWLATHEAAITNRQPLAGWMGGQLQPLTQNTRHAPYCAIAVDGYSGPRQPASSYPDIAYPAWTGISTQYDKPASSNIEFRDVCCNGFEVGIAIQPNQMPAASNGDFMHFTACDLGRNLVGLSISHSDARVLSVDRTRFHGCHTAIDSVSYGTGQGNLAASLANCSFDRVFRIFNIDLGIAAQPFAPAMVLTNAYGEAMYSLGTVRQVGGTGRPGAIRFLGGELGFSLRSAEHSPAVYLAGRGEVVARIEDVSIKGTYGHFPVDCELEHCSAVFPAVAQLVFDQSTAAGRRAASFLCGISAPRLGEVSVRPFVTYGVDGSARFDLRCRSHGFDFTGGGSASGAHLPAMARSVDFGGQFVPIGSAPQESLDRTVHPLTGLAQTGIEWSFAVPGMFLTDPGQPDRCLGRGDVVRDDATGHLFYVKSVVFTGSGATLQLELTLRQITGVRSADGVTWSSGATLQPASGKLVFQCARRIMPGARRRLAISTTGGSGTVAFAAIGPEVFAADDFGSVVRTLAVGDYLADAMRGAALVEDSVFPGGRISALALSGGQPTGLVTLDTPARRTGIWPAPVFIKAG